jgi:hypothetical protein
MRLEQILLTGDTETANAAYATNIERIEGIAEAAGITQGTLLGLAGEYRIDVIVQTSTILDKTLRYLFSLKGGSLLGLANLAATGFGTRAEGGPVAPMGTYLVGEKGPELLHMGPSGGFVTPMGSGSSSGSVGGDVRVTVLLDGQAIEPRMVKVVTDSNRDLRRRVSTR